MENFYLAALQAAEGIGNGRARRLREYFGSGKIAWEAADDDVRAAKAMPDSILHAFLQNRAKHRDYPERLQEECHRKGISLCSFYDEDYPHLLKEIHVPPLTLFYRGNLQNLHPRIAMVGSRKISAYGKNVAENLAKSLARKGFSIVSGAAMGVDTYSHIGALENGVTEAVLGCGVDVAYPASNKKLLAEIAERGAVISEYHPGMQPLASHFPYRNRIISGMSYGTVVVEAAKRSGSLITAQMALEEGRDVFAVPGTIFSPGSRGCNRLIQQGAKLVLDSMDIIEEYIHLLENKESSKNNNIVKNKTHAIITTEAEDSILRVMSLDEPLSIDDIIYRLQGTDVANVAFSLLQLEFKGLVRSDDLHRYIRKMTEGVL